MAEGIETLATYLHLARASGQRKQPLTKDKLLILAGVAAAENGLEEVGAYCRRVVLEHNPQHLVRAWPTLEDALADEDFQAYLKQLRRQYALEKAEHMLAALGIQVSGERGSYFSDHEYAVALLGHTPESITAAMARPLATPVRSSESAEPATSAARYHLAVWVALPTVIAVLAGFAVWWWRTR